MFSPIEPAPLQYLITRRIVHAIFTGKIAGGARLIEQDLASQFRISRSSVREALREIAAMGFIELRPNRGSVVLPFNPDSLRGIYEVRSALECRAARLAAQQIPLTEVEAFEQQYRDILAITHRDIAWSNRVLAVDKEFHEMIMTWAGVARLAMEIRRYCVLAQLVADEVGETAGHDYQNHLGSIDEHLSILEAFRHRDSEKAVQAMRAHLSHAAECAVRYLFSSAAQAQKAQP